MWQSCLQPPFRRLAQLKTGGSGINCPTEIAGAGSLSLLLLVSGCVKPGAKPLPVLGQVPQFQLTSQADQPFDSRTLDGHIWVADFIYTTCDGPCPMMSHQMRRHTEFHRRHARM